VLQYVSEVKDSSFEFASRQWNVTMERLQCNEYVMLISEKYTQGVQVCSESVNKIESTVGSRIKLINEMRVSLFEQLTKARESGSVAPLLVLP